MDYRLEEKEDSDKEDNSGNCPPDLSPPVTSFLQSPEFIDMITKIFLPFTLDGVKQSLSAHAEVTVYGQTANTGTPLVKKMEVLELLWLPKDQSIPRSTSGSIIGKSIGKPPETRCRSDNTNIIERVVLDSVVENEAEQHEIAT